MCHETVYQALYLQARGGLKREVATALRTGCTRRKPHTDPQKPTGRFHDPMVDISERPADIEDRAVLGHWEGDSITGTLNQSAIATLIKRTTRYVMLMHLAGDHTAPTVRDGLVKTLGGLPDLLKGSRTWDQGPEMATHKDLALATDIDVYFCDPASPWQLGSNENTNGLLDWSPKVGHRNYVSNFQRRPPVYSRSTLSSSNAVLAVELFEEGFTAKSVALTLDIAPKSVQMLYQRWQLRGAGALVTRERRQYSFETKLEIVRRHANGESGRALAAEYVLPSPHDCEGE